MLICHSLYLLKLKMCRLDVFAGTNAANKRCCKNNFMMHIFVSTFLQLVSKSFI